MEKYFLKNIGKKDSHKLSTYEESGGYQTIQKVFKLEPQKVVEEVKISGLRGLGGAGFPTGMKWGFIPKNISPRYLVCNADEGEPGTFKDRWLMDNDPHLLLEGIMIASYALDIHTAYIFIRGEFYNATQKVKEAIKECYEQKYLGKNIFGKSFDLDIYVHSGAGAYICGEETALLEALEGKRGLPRVKPPFPAIEGLFGKPTVINNVETLCGVKLILEHGAKWYKSVGTEKNPGYKLFPISGHVNKPGVYELPFGMPVQEIIEKYGGGVPEGRKIKGVIPGGSSSGVLTASELNTPMDFETFRGKGMILGTASIIVMDETTDMVEILHNIMHFYAEESCGQCTPCREGTMWSYKILNRLMKDEGTREDIETLKRIAKNISGTTLCALADGAAIPLKGFVEKFPEDFEKRIRAPRRETPKPVIMR
ncbi:MAG: NADH-quinone oxidoreductase subunit NuoF [Deltaproteobacteria bacterium]|nr:NADH-quinone oxidoreductase subunit NuoF [Deltaproteobacteria bacterium]